MRAIGLFLLLVGSLVLLWPWYDHLFRFITIARADTHIYGGAALLGGIVLLFIGQVRGS